jgi:hypothetical protein
MLQADRWRYNRRTAGELPEAEANVYLADTMGELGLWYRVAPISLVGGSLQPIGGHNPFEPAALGSAILHGPYVTNFVDIYQRLTEAGAARLVTGPDTLSEAVHELMNPDKAAVHGPCRVGGRLAGGGGHRPRARRHLRPARRRACGTRPDMRAPAFWYRPPGLPLSRSFPARRALWAGERRAAPEAVPCEGRACRSSASATSTRAAPARPHDHRAGAAARGTGALAVHVVMRGHGGALAGPGSGRRTSSPRVRNRGRGAASRRLREDLGGQGQAGGRAAAGAGADVILLDDGFQNPVLAHDLSIVVVDAHRGFGNGRVLPAGPLREPVETGLARADIVLVDRARGGAGSLRPAGGASHRRADPARDAGAAATGLPFRGLPVLAFAGIGHPGEILRHAARDGGRYPRRTRARPIISRCRTRSWRGCCARPPPSARRWSRPRRTPCACRPSSGRAS